MTSIRLATALNVRSFQNLVNTLITSNDKWRDQLNQESLEDEFGRLRVWSGNLGALQKGHSSLDYRLRDSPLLSGNALKFLEELNHNLNEACAIVSETRLPYEDQAKPDSSESLNGDDDDDFFSEDDDSDAGSSKNELTMRYEEIVDIIDNLYKLSVRIRTPTIRSRSLKAASYHPKDPETGIDILGAYASYDRQHTEELLWHLRRPHVGETQSNDDYIVSRLAQSVTLRRRQFKYWKRHREKLAVSTIPEDSPGPVELPAEQFSALPRNENAEAVSPQPIIGKSSVTVQTGEQYILKSFALSPEPYGTDKF